MSQKKDIFKKFILNNSLLITLLVLVAVMSFTVNNFFSVMNLFNIFRQVSIVGIMAIGMTFVIIVGGIDLSAGSLLSLCVMVSGMTQKYGFTVSILATLAAGIIGGLINGLIISKIKVNPFMTTIATQILFLGFTYLVTKGKMITLRQERIFSFIGKENILGITVLFILLGLYRQYSDLSHLLSEGRTDFLSRGNEFQSLLATAYDVLQFNEGGVHLPGYLYINDII